MKKPRRSGAVREVSGRTRQGCRIDPSCWLCHHRAIMRADPSDDVRVPTFGPRMVCTRYGRRAAEMAGAAPARDSHRRAMAATPYQLRALQMLGGSTSGYTVTAMLEHGFKLP